MTRPAADAHHPAVGATPPPPLDDSRRRPAARRVALAVVCDEPLDVERHADIVGEPAAGAVVTFAGRVRDHDHGRAVVSLEYVAHPSAGQVVAEVAAEVAGRHPVDALAISHRVGDLAVGDAALAVAVAAAHRHEAFAAAEDLVETVKHRLPVWKRQVFDDGTDEWVACP